MILSNIEQSGFILSNSLNKSYLKENGITFTPMNIISEMFSLIEDLNLDYLNIKILEPSIGGGNFFFCLIDILKNKNILNKTNINSFLSNLYGFDIEIKFLELFKNNLKSYVLENFSVYIEESILDNFKLFNFLEYDFGNLKFDLIVGNPPYVRVHYLENNLKVYLKNNYPEIYSGATDLSLFFLYKSIQLLSQNGLTLFITSNKFATTKYGELFRKETYPYLYIYKDNYNNPFDSVQIDTAIISFSKNKILQKHKDINFSNGEEWVFNNKFLKNEISFKDLGISISNGMVSGCNKAHVINKNTFEEWILIEPDLINLIKPIVNGRDLNLENNTYSVNNYIIYAIKENFEKILNSKVLMEHFEKYKIELENRSWYKSKKNMPYFSLQSSSQIKDSNTYNLLTKRIGKLKFIKVPNDIFYMDTLYRLNLPNDIKEEEFLEFLSKEEILNNFYYISNKIGNMIEIHANKFERISLNKEEIKILKK